VRYRVLALDVDGTLLDPDGQLRPRTAAAIARASRAGIQPVLCTGRRYRRAAEIAHQLGLDGPLVCNSGALIKSPVDHQTLWRGDFSAALASEILGLFAALDQPAVVFTDLAPDAADFLVAAYPSGCGPFDDYVAQNRPHAGISPALTRIARKRPPTAQKGPQPDLALVFHICAIGTRAEMLAFQQAARTRFDGQIATFVQRTSRYRGTMCEILRHDASKWRAILHIAGLWGVEPEEICAVGDDENDIPMIKHAGLGVAMGHAAADVQGAADLITGSHDEDGVAMLVDEVLLK
jgi:hydroxymethylpyrimidine pyrophosphatase-like HAD family hydrolase